MKCFLYFKDMFRSKGQRSFKSSCSEAYPHGTLGLDQVKALNLRIFSFSELEKATRNFDPELKIGEGGFGSVYKGTIKPAYGKGEPLVVAIGKFRSGSSQAHMVWLAEVKILGVVEHPNVIKLIGHCSVDGEKGFQRLLVYEFMNNNSLGDHLFSQAFPPLPWKTRLQIILGAAQALAYLHEGFKLQIIHRDFKPSNVLLDDKFNPKLSDFGLAMEGPMDVDEHVSTLVAGTYGYSDPEYLATGHLSYKSEVWSFGVVLYEILSGRRSIDYNRPISEQSLVEWVKQFPADGDRLKCIMDPRLGNQYSIGAAREIAKLADTCLSTTPKERPKMSQVVQRLDHIVQVSEESNAQKKK